MAVTIAGGTQRRNDMPNLVGTATAYTETVTATGALDVLVPHSIINVLGTATTVIDTYTLGTGPYEGFRKYITLAQTATDGLGQVKIELSNAVGDPAQNVIISEFPDAFKLEWINDRWMAFAAMSLATGASMSTATT